MTRYRFNLLRILFFLSIIIMLGGCAKQATKDQRYVVGIQDEEKESRLSDFILGEGDTIDITVYRKRTPEFILGVGDTIDITVYRKKTSEFVLGMGDSLEISVYRHTDLDRSVQIDSNGMIMVPLIGDIQAAGKSVVELRDKIQQRLSDKYIVDPQVTINISERQSLKIESLSLSFTISAQKAGKIMFPIIGEVQAAGRHVNDLTEEIRQKLSKHFVYPEVSINVSPIQTLELEDLGVSTKISSTGKIMLPLVGDVYAAGKGVFELRDEIQQKLSKYIVDPQVTINVSAVQSKKVYVLGEVRSPGTLTLDQKMLVWEAIAKAGGFTTDANEKRVLLVRSEKDVSKVTALNLDIREMLKNGKLDQNVYLKNGDIIYAPPSFIANVERFMVRFHNIINPFVTIERGIILGPEALDVLRGKETEREIVISP